MKEKMKQGNLKWRKLSKNNSQKESKKASKAAKNIITYLNSYLCIREKVMIAERRKKWNLNKNLENLEP